MQAIAHGYPFIPFSVETYGQKGKPAISFLSQLGMEAEEVARKVSKSGCVAAAIRELSVRLCRALGSHKMYRASLSLLVGVTGRGVRAGSLMLATRTRCCEGVHCVYARALLHSA
jgi:hypothetical protein